MSIKKRITSLPAGRLDGYVKGLLEILATKVDAPRLRSELVKEMDRIAPGMLFVHDPFVPGILRATDLNSASNKLYVALSSLYRAFLVSDSWQTRQVNSVMSDSSLVERGVNKLLQDVRAYKLLKLNPNYNDVRILQFIDTRNEAVGGTALVVDPKSRSLRLTEITRTRLHNKSEGATPVVTVSYLANGVTTASTSDHGVENIVDIDEETFWAETAYSNNPVLSNVDGTTYSGFAVRVVVDLQQTGLINRIDLKPFGIHNPRLLSLETSTDNSTFTSVPGFVEPSTSSLWWTFMIAPTACRYVRITLLQGNYVENILHLPRSVNRNQGFFDYIADTELRKGLGNREDSEADVRKLASNPEFGLVLDSLGELEEQISKKPLPSDESSRINDLDRIVAPVMDLLGIGESPVLLSSRPGENNEPFVEYRNYSYTLGLFHLEVSQAQFYPEGEFVSPKFSIDGSLWEVSLEAAPSNIDLTDDLGNSYPASVVEYEIEISATRKRPILPTGVSTNHEVVYISPKTRTGMVKFSTTDSSPVVRRNGKVLFLGEHFSFSPTTRLLTLEEVAYRPGSIYLVSYTPTSGQAVVDIRGSFDSVQASPIDVFMGSSETGVVELTRTPFVDYEKVNDTTSFIKDEVESRFLYNTTLGQTTIDGEIWGIAETTVATAVLSTDGAISVSSTSGFASAGTVVIDKERIRYTGVTGTDFTGCSRGEDGTVASSHVIGAAAVSQGNLVYVPITVLVDGVRALNKTDYYKGEHPTLEPSNSDSGAHTYLLVGSTLYFGSPIESSRTIEVRYRVLSEYLALRMRFKQTTAGQRLYTPKLAEAVLLMNRAEI